MAVNAKAVVCSSFMLKGVGCEGELRFGILELFVIFICGAFAIFSFQLWSMFNVAHDFFWNLPGFQRFSTRDLFCRRVVKLAGDFQ